MRGRPKEKIDEARLKSLMAQGKTADEIATALGAKKRTIQRRIQQIRGPVAFPRPQAVKSIVETSEDDVPEELPPGVPLAMVDKWIGKIERAAEQAEAAGNIPAFATLTAKLVVLLEHKRKATPLPKTDPNELPDMIALADTTIERLHKIARELVA